MHPASLENVTLWQTKPQRWVRDFLDAVNYVR